MPPPIQSAELELDLGRYTLMRAGRSVRLEKQPMELLILLVEKRGQLVTREEIVSRLWGNGVFLDTERSINTAILKIRFALQDNPDDPHVIETVVGKGYRFVAPITVIAPDSAPASAEKLLPPVTLPRSKWRSPAIVVMALLICIALIVFAFGRKWLRTISGQKPIQSVAVLPLENLSGDPAQEYFADGVTEALVTDLSQLSSLRVISRTSVMRYKGTKKSLQEIARELQVDALVEGTVARSGDRVRITANLVQVSPERHLWADTYERSLRDVLALQDDVARAIANSIQIKLTPQERARLASAHTVNPEAYEAYLEGRYFHNKFGLEGWKKSIEYFERAIAKDPTWALPYAGLASSYWVLSHNKALPNELCRKAEAAASEALKRDDAIAEAHQWLAMIEFVCDWDWSSPEREFRRAIELNPSLGEAHSQYGRYLQAMGRTSEGLEETKRGVELDPLSNTARWERAHSLYLTGQYDAAAEQCRKMLEIDPNMPSGHQNLGDNYVLVGNLAEGIQELEKAVSLPGSGDRAVARLGYAYAVAGRRNDAQRMLDQLKELSKKEIMYVHPDLVAAVYAGLGQKQEAFAWLEKAYQVRGHDVIDLRYDPHFASLRSDPRFADLVRRIGLPP